MVVLVERKHIGEETMEEMEDAPPLKLGDKWFAAEDCAQDGTGKYKGKQVGLFGDIGCSVFNETSTSPLLRRVHNIQQENITNSAK